METESLIFDIDGTLWDTRELVARAWNQVFSPLGPQYIVDAQYLTRMFGKTNTEIAALHFPDFPQTRRDKLVADCCVAAHEILAADPCQVGYPGVKEVLEALARRYRLFIVSNCETGYPDLLMDKLQVRHCFQGDLCFGQTKTCKGETIRTLMARESIVKAVYIGDTQGDQEAAALAGIPFIWAAYGFGSPQRYDAKIDSIQELLALLYPQKRPHGF